MPFAAPTVLTAHSCVNTWWRAVHGTAAPSLYDRYRLIVRQGLLRAKVVATPTRAMLDALQREHGPVRGARVIYNGLDLSRFRSGAKESLIFSAGRMWDEAKNLATLARAANDLPWRVEVAGATVSPDGRSLDDSAARVRWLGELTPVQVASQLKRASIYALPARYEPFGLSVLEAAASGCALVLSDIPTFRELWPDSALFVHPEDAGQLADAINTLIEEPTLRIALAQRARARAACLNISAMADAYESLYGELSPAASVSRAWPMADAVARGESVAWERIVH
jgi:glycosyltransferase involved in cell wall biosynthesis